MARVSDPLPAPDPWAWSHGYLKEQFAMFHPRQGQEATSMIESICIDEHTPVTASKTSSSSSPKHPRVFTFLKLPGEIRNEIYDLAIVNNEYQLMWVNNNHKSKSLTYRHPHSGRTTQAVLPEDTAQRRRSLDTKNKPKAVRQRLPNDYYGPIPTTLLHVNKQMHDEAASVFYAKSTFHFHALGTLRHFLDQLTPVATKSITSLALNYRAYGNPRFKDNRIWKAKHDRLWEDLCWRVADECSLKNLLLDLTLNVSPTTFCSLDEAECEGIGAAWIKPLWAFQDIDLQRCWVRIGCDSKDDSVLEVESWKLRKDILGDAWDDEKESKRTAYGYERNGEKAANPMVITVSAPTITSAQHRPRGGKPPRVQKPYYSWQKLLPAPGSFFPKCPGPQKWGALTSD